MTRAILVNFHKYQNYGGEYYEPILDFFMQTMEKYSAEYDQLYILDSTWDIKTEPLEDTFYKKEFLGKLTVIKTDPSLRYYDAYKKVLPQIEEDLVLFLDNDLVVYKPDQIGRIFRLLSDAKDLETEELLRGFDIVTIFDTIGAMKVDLPDGKNKFCPYLFGTRRELLMKYLDIDWSPDAMPYTETFGLLTEAILKDGLKPYEWPEDKSNILFDGIKDGEKSLGTGTYHIRSGSLPAVLLAYREHDQPKYWEYITQQPKNEYLRQFCWYYYMLVETGSKIDIQSFLEDCDIALPEWYSYMNSFKKYHGLT